MKTVFEFRSHLVSDGEILPRPENFLPGAKPLGRFKNEIFLPELKHLPVYGGISRFRAENFAVAQPLLKGGLS
jgi:hypothetical protein